MVYLYVCVHTEDKKKKKKTTTTTTTKGIRIYGGLLCLLNAKLSVLLSRYTYFAEAKTKSEKRRRRRRRKGSPSSLRIARCRHFLLSPCCINNSSFIIIVVCSCYYYYYCFALCSAEHRCICICIPEISLFLSVFSSSASSSFIAVRFLLLVVDIMCLLVFLIFLRFFCSFSLRSCEGCSLVLYRTAAL